MPIQSKFIKNRGLIVRLRSRLLFGRADLKESYLRYVEAGNYLHGHSQLIDEILRSLWSLLNLDDSISFVAVGGYGREELFPESDIDLVILLPHTPNPEQIERITELIALFWDIGLKIGLTVRTLDECISEASTHLSVQTALLEARLVIGNKLLFSKLAETCRAQLDKSRFFHAKRIEQEERHRRFNDTPNNLEPNCKESPGGLRDLQTILWIAQAAGFGYRWKELFRNGLISHQAQRSMERRENRLRTLRIQLHFYAQRHEDRLLFGYQRALAERLNFQDTDRRQASELLMQDYYRISNSTFQSTQIILQTMAARIFPLPEAAPKIINARFQNVQNWLDIGDENLFDTTPTAIFEAFLLMEQHRELKGMTARTMQALWRTRKKIDQRFRDDTQNKASFLALFKESHGILHELRRMNAFDILGRYLPKFGEIVGQMQHDLFHVYTVDQHILQVLRNLRRFSDDEFGHEYPFCSQLICDFDRPWRLYIAALFHDIAKGRGGNHAELGAIDAEEFCANHNLPPEDSELIIWLVRHHLLMSTVAQKQDVSDPDVLAAFAKTAKDEEHLTALYLLTVADIRGTSPTVWNSWKGQLLETLFRETRRLFQEGGRPRAKQGVIQERLAKAQRLLQQDSAPPEAYRLFWDRLDTVYFLRHSAEEIAWHASLLHKHLGEHIIKARLSTQGETIEVVVYARDEADLFVKLVAYLSRLGCNILDAKIHTTNDNFALDSFVLQPLTGHEPSALAMIEQGLRQTINADSSLLLHTPLPPLQALVSGQVRHFPIRPEVSIVPDDKGLYHLLSVNCSDRRGLLYTIAKLLAAFKIKLHTAKIVTLGERVEDIFLLSGAPLTDSATRIKLETELLQALQ